MQILFILGMHRSGTSALARCLNDMGTSFVLPKIQDGYWEKHVEYYQINQLNDNILNSWKAPKLKRNIVFKKTMEYETAKFMSEFIPQGSLVGVKDPRIILTFDYWIRNVKNSKIIGIFRRPEEVAKSLSIRDEYGKASFEKGLELWNMYNERLLQIHKKYQFPIINFNNDKKIIGFRLEEICEMYSIPFSQEVFDSTFTDKQKHHYSDNIPVSCRATFEQLLHISEVGDSL